MQSSSVGDQHKGIRASLEYLKTLAQDEFYGTLEIRFEAGNIVHLVERSLKPESLETSDKLRSNHAGKDNG
jgi:hypothetical protein